MVITAIRHGDRSEATLAVLDDDLVPRVGIKPPENDAPDRMRTTAVKPDDRHLGSGRMRLGRRPGEDHGRHAPPQQLKGEASRVVAHAAGAGAVVGRNESDSAQVRVSEPAAEP